MDAAEFRAAKQFIFNDTEREIELARASEPLAPAAVVEVALADLTECELSLLHETVVLGGGRLPAGDEWV